MNSYSNIEKTKEKIKIIVNVGNEKLDNILTENTIKQISKITKKYSSKKEIEIITDLDLNSLYKNDNLRWSLVSCLNIAKIKDKTERLYKAYDASCKYLDNEFVNKNLCEFKNDVCLEKSCYDVKNGCCHQFKNKIFGAVLESQPEILCRFQKDKHCTADCLGCKLFVCNTIKYKKGVHYTTFNVPIIKYYFNIIQKILIKCIVFTHKDDVLKVLKRFSF